MIWSQPTSSSVDPKAWDRGGGFMREESASQADILRTVARIAYLSSDVIVSVQPSLAADSHYSSHLKRYAGRKDQSLVAQSSDAVPDVCSALLACL